MPWHCSSCLHGGGGCPAALSAVLLCQPRRHYAPLATRLAQAGVITAVMQYTLFPNALVPQMLAEASCRLVSECGRWPPPRPCFMVRLWYAAVSSASCPATEGLHPSFNCPAGQPRPDVDAGQCGAAGGQPAAGAASMGATEQVGVMDSRKKTACHLGTTHLHCTPAPPACLCRCLWWATLRERTCAQWRCCTGPWPPASRPPPQQL